MLDPVSGARYSWDEAKRAANLAKHGVDFAAMLRFDWNAAFIEADVRHGYGEVRLVAVGPIGTRLHTLIYTVETRSVRVISLRPSSRREVTVHAANL